VAGLPLWDQRGYQSGGSRHQPPAPPHSYIRFAAAASCSASIFGDVIGAFTTSVNAKSAVVVQGSVQVRGDGGRNRYAAVFTLTVTPAQGAESNEVIERQLVHSVPRDLGDAWLRHPETLGRLRLGNPFLVDPPAQRLRQLTPQKHDRRLVWWKAELNEDVSRTVRPPRRFLHDVPPIAR
jgi:hypothetical protein